VLLTYEKPAAFEVSPGIVFFFNLCDWICNKYVDVKFLRKAFIIMLVTLYISPFTL